MKTYIQKISLMLALAVSGLFAQAQTIEVSVTIPPLPKQVISNGGAPFDATAGGFVSDFKPYLPVTVTIKNTGSAALTLTKSGGKYINLGGTGATDFTIDESTITNSTLAANETTTFKVNLSSSATNGTKTVTLTILSNDAVNATYTGSIKYALSGITTSLTKASEIGLSLYPNPSSDGHFFITANNVAVEKVVVSNVSGVTEEFAAKEFRTSLKGLLLVKIYTDKGIVSEKVIIQE